jgi:hypothetical protein
MQLFRSPLIYVQVFPSLFMARIVGESKTIRRDCHALNNRQHELKDFSRIRSTLRDIFKELAPGFSLRRPKALMHFIPEHYTPTQSELAHFKSTAERAGVSFCWMSKWETAHTDKELTDVFGTL